MINKQTYQLSMMCLAIAACLFAINCYYVGFAILKQVGYVHSMLNTVVWDVRQKTGLLTHAWVSPLVIAMAIFASQVLRQSAFASPTQKKSSYALLTSVLLILFHTLIPISGSPTRFVLYVGMGATGYILWGIAVFPYCRNFSFSLFNPSNIDNEQFTQQQRLITNPVSVNIKTDNGFVNIVNPFSGTIITGVPGSGKTYVFVQEFIDQLFHKGFGACIYDYKGDLTPFAYNASILHYQKVDNSHTVVPRFAVFDIDNPTGSIRLNPLAPYLLATEEDCIEAATIFYLNLNRNYARKKGDFFMESALLLISCGILFLRYASLSTKVTKEGRGHEGNCCSLPHLIALICGSSPLLFDVLAKFPATKHKFSIFKSAEEKEAHEQLEGQVASAKIALSRLSTPHIFWALSGSDVNLTINDAQSPVILCLKNNTQREEAYSPALGLIIGQLIKVVNQPGKVPSLICMDEAATIFVKKLDQLIATARSNKVAVVAVYQDFAQLLRDYGKEVADVVINTMGNRITGRVVRETAKDYEALFGKVLQRRYSQSESKGEVNTSISTTLDSLLPAARIANFSQGEFAGSLTDTLEQPTPMKLFRGKVLMPADRWKAHQQYSIPELTHFQSDIPKTIKKNYETIQQEVIDLLYEYY
jgi:TraM recognition site of TraD and TraG